MVKEEKPILLKSVIFVSLFLIIEAGAFIYFLTPSSGLSGFSIINVSEAYSKFYPHSKIFLIVQWVILVLLLVFVYFKNIGIHRRNKEIKGVNLKAAIDKSKTNLDAFYNILQEKKSLSVKTISKLFNIPTDLSMEWARILEAGDLVTIDYPGIGSPIVKIPEEPEEETKNDEKDKGKNKDKTKKEENKNEEKEGKKEDKNNIGKKVTILKKGEVAKSIEEEKSSKKEDKNKVDEKTPDKKNITEVKNKEEKVPKKGKLKELFKKKQIKKVVKKKTNKKKIQQGRTKKVKKKKK